MTPHSIKAQIALRGVKHGDLAKKIGCSEVELSQTIQGDRKNPKIRKKLAAIFGMSEEEMFDAEFQAVVDYRARKTA